TSDTEDCSPIAPSAGVPTGCRRTLAAARRSAIAPAGSKDGLRSRKAAKGYGSALPTHCVQASGSFSADGSPAPAPQAKCTKTTDPDPKIPPACKPPPIRDRKTESANPRYGEGFFSKLLGGLADRDQHHRRIGAKMRNRQHEVARRPVCVGGGDHGRFGKRSERDCVHVLDSFLFRESVRGEDQR